MRRIAALLAALPCLPATPALAHDPWIERAGDTLTLLYGHVLGDLNGNHGGAKQVEYRPDTVKRAACFDTAGGKLPARAGTRYPVTLDSPGADCAASYFLLSSGYWSKTPYGTKNLPKDQAGAVLDSWLSWEGIKRIDRWGEALARPLSPDLELAPARDPLALHAGDKLPVRAFFQGQPVAGVTVAYFGKPRGVTDADGRVNIRLAQPGLQMIQASLERPLGDAKADKAIHAATLQFELP